MNGEQRYRQATTKARILSNRNLRQFLADEIDWLPMAKDREFIISEFDRLQAEIDRLRWAIEPIAGFPDWPERGDHELTAMRVTFGHLRALRAALANSSGIRKSES
jgi:hypothetical protein